MARRSDNRQAATRKFGTEAVRLSRLRIAGNDCTFSRRRRSWPVPADGRAGVDLLARRSSHILDWLQESGGGAHELGSCISRAQPPAANHHDAAGRCPEGPSNDGADAPRAGWRSRECPMTNLLAARIDGLLAIVSSR